MSKITTFSTEYPSYHPKSGQPTYFVEKLISTFIQLDLPGYTTETMKQCRDKGILSVSVLEGLFYEDKELKYHTVRAGHRFKPGDWFSPRVWGKDINPKSGKSGPYHSKQIIIGPDVQVKKVWDMDVEGTDFTLSGRFDFTGSGFDLSEVAKNDGLEFGDFFDWFTLSPEFKKKQTFSGQIICWAEKIEY